MKKLVIYKIFSTIDFNINIIYLDNHVIVTFNYIDRKQP
jgi:hypothetical protein